MLLLLLPQYKENFVLTRALHRHQVPSNQAWELPLSLCWSPELWAAALTPLLHALGQY